MQIRDRLGHVAGAALQPGEAFLHHFLGKHPIERDCRGKVHQTSAMLGEEHLDVDGLRRDSRTGRPLPKQRVTQPGHDLLVTNVHIMT